MAVFDVTQSTAAPKISTPLTVTEFTLLTPADDVPPVTVMTTEDNTSSTATTFATLSTAVIVWSLTEPLFTALVPIVNDVPAVADVTVTTFEATLVFTAAD